MIIVSSDEIQVKREPLLLMEVERDSLALARALVALAGPVRDQPVRRAGESTILHKHLGQCDTQAVGIHAHYAVTTAEIDPAKTLSKSSAIQITTAVRGAQ